MECVPTSAKCTLKNWFIACVHRVIDARRKFREHEGRINFPWNVFHPLQDVMPCSFPITEGFRVQLGNS